MNDPYNKQPLQSVMAHHARGLYEAGRYSEALQLAEKYLVKDKNDLSLLDIKALCALALGDVDLAERSWIEVIQLEPRSSLAYFYLGNLYQDLKRWKESEVFYLKSLAVAPDSAQTLHFYGGLLFKLGRQEEAETSFRKALVLQPRNVEVYNNLGVVLMAQKRFRESEECYRYALSIEPRYAAAYDNLAKLYAGMNQYQQALECCQKSLLLRPNAPTTLVHLGYLNEKQEKIIEAEHCYQQALAIDGLFLEAYLNLGGLYARSQQSDKAVKVYEQALAINPGFVEGHILLARLSGEIKQLEKAIRHYKTTIELCPTHVEAHYSLANIYREENRLEEAKFHYLKALEKQPDNFQIRNNLGLLYASLDQLDEAESALRQALLGALNPPEILVNLSHLLLAQGRFEEGWKLYEYRYDPRMENPYALAPGVPFPQWKGESLQGRSLLICHEMGFGDVIQFSRYVDILKKQGARHITFVCKKSIKSLLETLKGVDNVLSLDEVNSLTPCDYWTFLLSVPLYLKTDLQTIPSAVGYLSVPKDRKHKWRDQLPKQGLKVGVVWKGSLRPHDDRPLSHLSELRPLWTVPGITFISLQKGEGEEEALHSTIDQPLLPLGSEIDDFSDTASLVDELDLLISIDTSVAHLAGAMGKKVWMLTSFTPDWRWMLKRDDSPWYPTMRMFRQKKIGDWSSVIKCVTDELKLFAMNFS